jgi:excisionase family DNA binding protein
MRVDASFARPERFAGISDLGPRTVWKLIAEGKLPVIRVGRRTLIPIDEGLAALRAIGKASPTGEAPPSEPP